MTSRDKGDGSGVPNPVPDDPGDPDDPNHPQTLPMQSYACLDLSGSVQGSNPVDRVVLNDSGVAAFGFQSGDTYTTYQSTNGQPHHVQDLDLEVAGENADGR